jgi:hypothetical protein
MYNRGSKRSAKRTTTTARLKNKYRPQMIEALECRQLLTTLYGGGAGQAATYIYTTAGATPPTPADAQITIYGDVIAEFIFVDGTGAVVNRPVTFNGPGGVNDGTGGSIVADPGLDLFAIYVAKSDINSYISIEAIGTSDPFGGVTSLSIIPANPKPSPAPVTSGSGQLRLGALTGGTTGSPVIKTDINGSAIGVRPAGLDDLPEDPTTDLSAGLRVANGQDLGKFMFDGEVFGKVHVDGSMNLFYAGWLLTGDARGADEGLDTSGLPISLADNFVTPQDTALGASRHIVPRQNFYVGGDLQNLVSDGAIGWDATFAPAGDIAPYYLSGVDIYVRGRIGQIHGNEGNAATVTALNLDPAVAGFTRPVVYQEELEGFWHFPTNGVANNISSGFPNTSGSDFSGGVLYGPRTGRGVVPTGNDSFTSFQMLNGFSSPRGNDIVDLIGALNPQAVLDQDPIDFYGVALMAGQTITIQALQTNSSQPNILHVGVFDPDGRLIASDYSNLTTPNGAASSTHSLPFQITADRPGIYRIAISENGDVDFTGTGHTTLGLREYELIVSRLGGMAAGGVTVMNQSPATPLQEGGAAMMLNTNTGQHQIEASNGDFGGVYVSDQFNTTPEVLYVPTAPPAPGSLNPKVVFGTVYVSAGNLRAFDASQIGSPVWLRTGLDLNVPNGSVGLVQARVGELSLNPSVNKNFGDTIGTAVVPTTPTTPIPFTPASLSIGRDYQVINAAGPFFGAVAARGGMGTLRTGSIDPGDDAQTFIYLDTDNSGFDGKSDLIDVAGDVAGPALIHGPGGNFRYMRVGGAVGTDPFFGSSISRTVYDYGQSVSFTDDSGSSINLSPVGLPTPNPVFNPQDPSTGPVLIRPQLSTQIYPVRSGGVIVMDVQSTGSLAVNTVGGAVNSTAEISRIEVHGSGAAPVRTTRGVGRNATTTIKPAFTSNALKNDLSVVITGSATTDVAYIVGMVPESSGNFWLSTNPPTLRSGESAFGNLTLVSNNTGGEILEVHAANLGTLRSTGTIGVTRTTTIAGNSLNFLAPLALGSSYGARDADVASDMPIQPTGTVVGTAFPFNGQTYGIAINGDIAVIQANMGLGNIVSTGIIGQIVANADNRNVGVQHEGIEAPIYATGTTIGSGQTISGVPDGSILAIDIGEGMGSAGSGDFARTGIFAANNIGSIVGDRGADIRGDIYWGFQLGSLTLRNGSLIDANLVQSRIDNIASIRESASASSLGIVSTGGLETNLGSINIGGNGGIIGTLLMSLTMNSINVDGFGILDSHIETSFSGFINKITVGGYGIRNTIINGGNTIGAINVTGNGKKLSTYKVPTDVRQSEFVRADPQFNFGFDPYSGRALTGINDIHAALGTSQASPVVPGVTDTGVVEDSRITGQRDLGSIKAQVFRGDPAYNRIAFGNSIGTIQSRGIINGLTVVTGRIKNFNPAAGVGNLHMTISGSLDRLTINGNLNKGSTIEAIGPNGRIGTVNIKRSLNGTIHATQSIGTVTIGKNLNGSLKIDALARGGMALRLLKVGGTISNGSLDIGSRRNIANVGQIIVGKSLGKSADDSLFISGTLDRLQVGGSLNATVRVRRGIGTLQARRIGGNVTTGGDLKNLLILKKGLHGNLTVRNHLQNANIHGVIDGNITANNGIGTITAGSVVAGNTIESQFGSIGTLRIYGDLDGNVNTGGQIGQIIAGGNVGDGTTPMSITADHLGLLDVGGSIRNGVTIRIRGPIDALIVGKNVDEGAIIQASAVHRNQIHGDVFGSLLIG